MRFECFLCTRVVRLGCWVCTDFGTARDCGRKNVGGSGEVTGVSRGEKRAERLQFGSAIPQYEKVFLPKGWARFG